MLVGYIQDGRHSGIDKYLLGFCDVAFENGVTLDLLTDRIDPSLKAQFDKKGFSLFEIPSLKKPASQYKAIKEIIKNGGYDAAYFNISEAFNCTGVFAAAACRVPVRIVHSHNSGVDKNNKYVRAFRTLLHKIFRFITYKKATKCLACSNAAGEWMFPCDFDIIYNAVDSTRFVFDEQKRKDVRNTLSISDDTKVFIHIGHFCHQKNNFFLMEVIKEIVKKQSSALLLSVGNGPDFDAVKEYAKKLGIENNVKFLGVRSDVADLLCAADVFLLPSRFEGLGIVLIEAQFTGLACVVSDRVPQEAKISENFVAVPANNAQSWADAALALADNKRGSAKLFKNAFEKYSFDSSKNQFKAILETDN